MTSVSSHEEPSGSTSRRSTSAEDHRTNTAERYDSDQANPSLSSSPRISNSDDAASSSVEDRDQGTESDDNLDGDWSTESEEDSDDDGALSDDSDDSDTESEEGSENEEPLPDLERMTREADEYRLQLWPQTLLDIPIIDDAFLNTFAPDHWSDFDPYQFEVYLKTWATIHTQAIRRLDAGIQQLKEQQAIIRRQREELKAAQAEARRLKNEARQLRRRLARMQRLFAIVRSRRKVEEIGECVS